MATLYTPLDNNMAWKKALRFADEEQRQRWQGYAKQIIENEKNRREQEQREERGKIEEAHRKKQEEIATKQKQYDRAISAMNEPDYPLAIQIFSKMKDYQESEKLLQQCINECRKIITSQLDAFYDTKRVFKWHDVKQETKYVDSAQKELDELTNAMREIEKRKNEVQEQICNCNKESNQLHMLFNGKKKQILKNEITALKEEKEKIEQQQCSTETEVAEALKKLQNEKNALEEARNALKKTEEEKKLANQKKWSDDEIIREASAQVVDYVTLGHYPQTESGEDITPIEWLILERDGQKALLISKYGLDAKPYNTEYTDVTWEECTLRTWLNDIFYNKAFSADEQAAILTTNVDNSKKQSYSDWYTSGGNDTQDKVFLLSYAEANKYFDVKKEFVSSRNMKSRIAPTAYAIAQGADIKISSTVYTVAQKANINLNSSNKTINGTNSGSWWLRLPGGPLNYAEHVYICGSLFRNRVSDASISVRPAMWVNLEALISHV